MHYSPAIFALFAGMVATTAAFDGFIVPRDAADGVYSSYLDANSEPVHEFVAPALTKDEVAELAAREPPATGSSPSRITARFYDSIECAGYELNHPDTQAAVTKLKNQCTPQGAINSGRSFWSKHGGVVAYICNFGSSAWSCNPKDINADFQAITSKCGSYKSGWRT